MKIDRQQFGFWRHVVLSGLCGLLAVGLFLSSARSVRAAGFWDVMRSFCWNVSESYDDERGNVKDISPAGAVAFILPTNGTITKGYEPGHFALDIANRKHMPVWAAADGIVLKAEEGWNGGYGTMVLIDHGGGWQTLYAHLDVLSVNIGDEVSQGDVIGLMGESGRVLGNSPHVHWEVRHDGVKQDPRKYY